LVDKTYLEQFDTEVNKFKSMEKGEHTPRAKSSIPKVELGPSRTQQEYDDLILVAALRFTHYFFFFNFFLYYGFIGSNSQRCQTDTVESEGFSPVSTSLPKESLRTLVQDKFSDRRNS
jgi:hypothetical protein